MGVNFDISKTLFESENLWLFGQILCLRGTNNGRKFTKACFPCISSLWLFAHIFVTPFVEMVVSDFTINTCIATPRKTCDSLIEIGSSSN